jgi:hypothetical protein
LALAALYSQYVDKGGLKYSFTIMTTESTNQLQWLHDRQPIFLSSSFIDKWLNLESNLSELINELRDQSSINNLTPELNIFPVTTKVNRLSYQEADCSQEVKFTPKISNFFSAYAMENSSQPNRDKRQHYSLVDCDDSHDLTHSSNKHSKIQNEQVTSLERGLVKTDRIESSKSIKADDLINSTKITKTNDNFEVVDLRDFV